METIFIPYNGSHPASIQINGHDVVILSSDTDALKDVMSVDKFVPVEGVETPDDLTDALLNLGVVPGCSIVLAPSEVSMDEVIGSLHRDLPWIQ